MKFSISKMLEVASRIDDKNKSPLTTHRTILVENIQIENELIIEDEESHSSNFFSSTLHSLGIIFGDM